jgi:hypothetical protein
MFMREASGLLIVNMHPVFIGKISVKGILRPWLHIILAYQRLSFGISGELITTSFPYHLHGVFGAEGSGVRCAASTFGFACEEFDCIIERKKDIV